MRFLRKLSFVFVAVMALFLSHNFVYAQQNYIGEDEIVIKDIKYKNVETEFQQKSTSPDETIPPVYDESVYGEQDLFPSLDGQTVSPTVLCEDASQSECISIGTAKGVAVGEPVYGDFYEQTSLWQEVSYNGKTYYVPYDNLSSGFVTQPVMPVVTQPKLPSLLNSPYVNTGTKTTTPQLTITVPGSSNNISTQSGGILSDIWGGVANTWNSVAGWVAEPRRVEGYGQVFWGGLNSVFGVVEVFGGAVLVTGGAVTEGGTVGISTPVSIPAMIGGVAAIGFGANNFISGITEIAGGLTNIFGDTQDEVVDYKFDPISKGIDATTEEGTALNTGLHFTHIAADFVATGGGALIIKGIQITGKGLDTVNDIKKLIEVVNEVKDVGKLADAFDDMKDIDRMISAAQGIQDVEKLAQVLNEMKDMEKVIKIVDSIKDINKKIKVLNGIEDLSKVAKILDGMDDLDSITKILNKLDPQKADDIAKKMTGKFADTVRTLRIFVRLSSDAKIGLDYLKKYGEFAEELLARKMTGMSESQINRFLERIKLFEIAGDRSAAFEVAQQMEILKVGDNLGKYINAFKIGRRYNLVELTNLNPDEIGRISVQFVDGKFKYLGDRTLRGLVDFVYKDGKIYIGKSHIKLAQPDINKVDITETVDFAGQLHFNDKGILNRWNNISGHFKPDVTGPNDRIVKEFIDAYNTQFKGANLSINLFEVYFK